MMYGLVTLGFFYKGMGQERFLSLLKFLHFSAHDQIDKHLPKTQIKPFFELLCSKSITVIVYAKKSNYNEGVRSKLGAANPSSKPVPSQKNESGAEGVKSTKNDLAVIYKSRKLKTIHEFSV